MPPPQQAPSPKTLRIASDVYPIFSRFFGARAKNYKSHQLRSWSPWDMEPEPPTWDFYQVRLREGRWVEAWLQVRWHARGSHLTHVSDGCVCFPGSRMWMLHLRHLAQAYVASSVGVHLKPTKTRTTPPPKKKNPQRKRPILSIRSFYPRPSAARERRQVWGELPGRGCPGVGVGGLRRPVFSDLGDHSFLLGVSFLGEPRIKPP